MITMKGLNKSYRSSTQTVHALKDINLEIDDDGFVVILGKSGSGKSTMLNIIGGLDKFDDGDMLIWGNSTKNFNSNDWDAYRNTYVGVVFQEFYIIDELTVGKNIALALELQGYPKEKINERVVEILKQVELEDYKDRYPNQLSGGQKQRIAIARALIKNPSIILADEPTGNLDSETAKIILDILKKLSKTKLVIMVTHDTDFARIYGDRIIELSDGKIINDNINRENQEQIHSGNDFVDSVIVLPKGKELSHEIIDYLNEVAIKGEKELHFTFGNRAFINEVLPDVVHNTVTSINKEIETKPIAFKKTALPLKHAFKLAFNSMVKRKVRLTVTTILFVISLLFVGIALNFSLYDFTTGTALTFQEANINDISLLNYNERGVLKSFTNEDFIELRSEYPNIYFSKVYWNKLSFKEINDTYEFNRNLEEEPYYSSDFLFIGIYEEGSPISLSLGKFPNDNEVVITDYMADMLIYYNVFPDVISHQELLGRNFDYNGQTLTISGISKTNYYDMEYNFLNYINKGFGYNQYETVYMIQSTYDRIFYTNYRFSINKKDTIYVNVAKPLNDYTSFMIEGSQLPNKENEIVLTYSMLKLIDENVNLENSSEYLNSSTTFLKKVYNEENNVYWISTEYKIVGIVDDTNNKINFDIIFSESLIDKIRNSTTSGIQIRAFLSEDVSDNIKLFRDIEEEKDVFIKHESQYSELLYRLEEIKDKYQNILNGIGLFFATFASILIYTLISISIIDKKKEIGTLRALGAKRIDIAKIFITEGLIIAIISAFLSNICIKIIVDILNNAITTGFNTSLILLHVGFLNVALVFILALVIVFVSSFIPIIRITKLKPIDAIKNLK